MIVSCVKRHSLVRTAIRSCIAAGCAVAVFVACSTAYAGDPPRTNTSYVPPVSKGMSPLQPIPGTAPRQIPAALVHFEVSFPKSPPGSPLQLLYGSSILTSEHAIHAGTSRRITNPVSGHAAPLVIEDLVLTYTGQSRDWISLHLAYEQLTPGEDPGRSVSKPTPVATQTRLDTDVTLPICPADHHCVDTLVTVGDSGARLRLGAMPYDRPLTPVASGEK